MTKAAAGAGLLLIVLAAVVKDHYLQIEWQLTTAVPAAWWYAAEAAEVLGGALFCIAVGVSPLSKVVPNLLWYSAAVAAALGVLWRYGPGYGLTPVRDLPELLQFLLLPPPGLALSCALVLFPVVARVAAGVPTPVVLGAGVTAAVLAFVAAAHLPVPAATAVLPRHLLFLLIGWRLGWTVDAFATRKAPASTRPLAAVGRAAVPIAAILVPTVALTGAVLVKRLSVLDGPAQTVVALAHPVLLTAAIVTAGSVLNRMRRVAR